jgi:calcineurin-like phosphoesterase family protein
MKKVIDKLFFVSDMHFCHSNLYRFKDESGNLQRHLNQEDCELLMIEKWNKVVKNDDDVFILGDAVMDCKPRKTEEETQRIMEKRMSILENLNGYKIIILGNHDTRRVDLLSKYFDEVCGSLEMKLCGYRCILTHIPIHASQLRDRYNEGRFDFNIHGHLHAPHKILISDGEKEKPDYRYVNVNVEYNNYSPISHINMANTLSKYSKILKCHEVY